MLFAEFGVGVGVGLMPARLPDGNKRVGCVVPEPKLPEHAASVAPTTIRTATRNRALFIEGALRRPGCGGLRYVYLAPELHELFGLLGHSGCCVIAHVLRDFHRAE